MPSVPVYNQEGQKVETINLDERIFGIKPKMELIQKVVVSMQANARRAIAHTKGRGEVRGGGRKPWRQKGTGRARHGSIRSPLWIGGGVTFGPTSERNFKQKINKKVNRQALFMVLSDKVAHNNLLVIEDVKFEKPKTKQGVALLQNLQVRVKKAGKHAPGGQDKNERGSKEKSVLVVLPQPHVIFSKSLSNIPKVKVIHAVNLNTLNVLGYERLLMTKNAVKRIEKIFAR